MTSIEYSSSTIQKIKEVLMLFDDVIADMISNKKVSCNSHGFFFRGQKLNTYLAFLTQSYLPVPKDLRLNTAHFLIIKIQKKIKIQQIAIDHSLILTLKTSWSYTENVPKKDILWSLILFIHHILILRFWKRYRVLVIIDINRL